MESVVAQELRRIGLNRVKEERSAVRFHGSLSDGYRACLWSRSASRILLRIKRFECPDADALYEGVRGVDWSHHLSLKTTFAVDFVGGSKTIRHNQFGARKVKDAIADQLREVLGARPDVSVKQPDIPIHLHLSHAVATLSLDLCGEALHQRGLGRMTGSAPLRETLAASLLLIADWPKAARTGRSLLDPMCGSGTLLLEAAGLALDRAPGLARTRWAFQRWPQHDVKTWTLLTDEARERAEIGTAECPPIRGRDIDPRVLQTAKKNIERSGLSRWIHIEEGPLDKARPQLGEPPGLLITNPPYGERIGETEAMVPIHRELGDRLRKSFLGWDAWVLCGRRELMHALGLKTARRHIVHNGPLECRFVHLPIAPTPPKGGPGWRERSS
jgi:23S rRNA (guanine2445-N2)-methyltransferase / 23S rRNA (guanine2069-N7)-methyltransferase